MAVFPVRPTAQPQLQPGNSDAQRRTRSPSFVATFSQSETRGFFPFGWQGKTNSPAFARSSAPDNADIGVSLSVFDAGYLEFKTARRTFRFVVFQSAPIIVENRF